MYLSAGHRDSAMAIVSASAFLSLCERASTVIELSPWSFCLHLLLLSYLKHTYDFATAKVNRHSRAARLDGALATQIIFKQMSREPWVRLISAKALKGENNLLRPCCSSPGLPW